MDDTEIPKNVVLFRKILNHVKRNLLDKEDSSNDNQDIGKLHETTDRIQQFGNIVLSLLRDSDTNTNEHQSVKNLFNRYKFVIPDRGTFENNLCIYYVKNDVFLYPYDLNPSHIDTVEKS